MAKNNVKGEKRMKKYMKRIVSWMCAVLMTLGMAVPVLATDSSANSVSETENRPSGVGVSFHQGTENQIEVGNGKSKITLDLSFVNPVSVEEEFMDIINSELKTK